MRFSLPDDKRDAEYNGLGFVEISKNSAVHYAIFSGTDPFWQKIALEVPRWSCSHFHQSGICPNCGIRHWMTNPGRRPGRKPRYMMNPKVTRNHTWVKKSHNSIVTKSQKVHDTFILHARCINTIPRIQYYFNISCFSTYRCGLVESQC